MNAGTFTLAAGRQLALNAPLANAGTLAVGGALVTGNSTLTNTPLGTITGPGTISAPLVNAGTLVAQTGTLNVTQPFVNSNLIQLGGAGSSLNGAGGVTNTGTLQGAGAVGLPVVNAGTVESIGGTLAFNGPLTNGPAGLLRAGTGTKLLVSSGLATNAGVISLTGGTFDNGNKPLLNTGQIVGYGTLATAALTNAASLVFASGPSTVNGPLTNAAGATVRVNVTSVVFSGAVTNNGLFQVQSGVATFAGGFTNNGLYVSDPSTNAFASMTVGETGALVGGAGDRFTLTGDLRSRSALPAAWNTTDAALVFLPGDASTHTLDVNGVDGNGNTGNFGWGSLEVTPGQSLLLHDADAAPGGALYASVLQLDGAPANDLAAFIATTLVNADPADAINVYYDPTQRANAYLADGTYALGNGGTLAPSLAATPEPSTLALAACGALTLGRRRRRRRA